MADKPEKNHPRLQVRFSDHVVVISMNDDAVASWLRESSTSRALLTDEKSKSIMSSLWWSKLEMKQFRQVAKLVSRDTREKSSMTKSLEREYSRSVRVAYGEQEHLDESSSSNMELQVLLEDIKPSEGLIDWCRFGHCKRGLEQWSSTQHQTARSMAANQVRCRVLAIQKQSCGNADRMQEASEHGSRVSRVFARLMGLADANALLLES